MTDEEKEELPKEETEETEEEEEETQEEEPEEDELMLAPPEITPVPLILCPDHEIPMEITGVEVKDIEKRQFLFKTTTEAHRHLRYECPECGQYFLYDMQKERQGCFIATAAYGTPLAEEINVLRKVRDSYLIHRNWGKELVNAYYRLSPPIAKVIEKSENLKKLVRTFLVPIVRLFKEKDD